MKAKGECQLGSVWNIGETARPVEPQIGLGDLARSERELVCRAFRIGPLDLYGIAPRRIERKVFAVGHDGLGLRDLTLLSAWRGDRLDLDDRPLVEVFFEMRYMLYMEHADIARQFGWTESRYRWFWKRLKRKLLVLCDFNQTLRWKPVHKQRHF